MEEALRNMGDAHVAGIKLSIIETLVANYGSNRIIMNGKEALQFSQQMALFLRVMPEFEKAVAMSFARFQDKKAVNRRMVIFQQQIRTGQKQSTAVAAIGFPAEFLPEIRMAEQNSVMGEVFERIATTLKERMALKNSIKTALVTPVLTILILCVTFVVMLLYVFPKLTKLFQEAHGVAKSSALAFDMFLVNNKGTLAFSILAFLASFIVILSTKRGRKFGTDILFRVPFFKDVILVYRTARFSLAIEMPLASSLGNLDSMERVLSTATTADKKVYRKIYQRIKAGDPLGLALLESKHFPPDFCDWVGSVDKAGRLGSEFPIIRSTYEEILKQRFEAVKTYLGPFLVVVAGGAILVMAGALYAPIFQMVQSFMSMNY